MGIDRILPVEAEQVLLSASCDRCEAGDCERWRDTEPKCLQNEPYPLRGGYRRVLAQGNCLCDGGHKALEAEDIEHAGKVVTERHQAPFAADLVEAANQKVAIAGAAFERAKGMFDDGGTTAHQLACTFHPRPMTFENIFV